tara:strand:+ start:720 stop:926 length:207 start_codon:yes stop_codon:yes gene_type:complete
MKICKRQYRIVTDKWLGFEVQKRDWYSPFWYQLNFSNTSDNIERAEKLIDIDKAKYKKRKVIKTYPCD